MTDYWYFISNRCTRQCIDAVAGSPEAACARVGWDVEDCLIIQVGALSEARVGAEPDLDVSRGPRRTRS